MPQLCRGFRLDIAYFQGSYTPNTLGPFYPIRAT